MKRIHSNNVKNVETFDETDWLASSFSIQLPIIDKKRIPKLNSSRVKMVSKLPRPSQSLVDVEKFKSLIDNKSQIDTISEADKKKWTKWIKLLNPFEKIGAFSSLSNDITISRAFYKLHEILVHYKFIIEKHINVKSPFTSLHLCEAPGGFVSAIKYLYPNVDWYAHTLYEGSDSLVISPTLDMKKWLLYKRRHERGFDGNLYKLDTINNIKKELPRKAHIITGDGGFDVSFDPNHQEQISMKLIYAQCLTALHCQEIGGIFICKIFDSFTRPTCQLLVLLSKYYETVSIIKPRTSRYSNSEKYLVAVGFLGIGSKELGHFDNVLKNWKGNLRTFGFELDLLPDFSKKMKEYNDFLAVNQSWYIHQSICCHKYFGHENSKTSKFNPQSLEVLQNKKAFEFCTAFGLKELNNKDFTCLHTHVAKINHESVNNIFKCTKCLKLLVNAQ